MPGFRPSTGTGAIPSSEGQSVSTPRRAQATMSRAARALNECSRQPSSSSCGASPRQNSSTPGRRRSSTTSRSSTVLSRPATASRGASGTFSPRPNSPVTRRRGPSSRRTAAGRTGASRPPESSTGCSTAPGRASTGSCGTTTSILQAPISGRRRRTSRFTSSTTTAIGWCRSSTGRSRRTGPLVVTAQVRSVDGVVVGSGRRELPCLGRGETVTVAELTVGPPDGVSGTYFLELALCAAGDGTVVSRNVYWLSERGRCARPRAHDMAVHADSRIRRPARAREARSARARGHRHVHQRLGAGTHFGHHPQRLIRRRSRLGHPRLPAVARRGARRPGDLERERPCPLRGAVGDYDSRVRGGVGCRCAVMGRDRCLQSAGSARGGHRLTAKSDQRN